jgi:hypothetical protein
MIATPKVLAYREFVKLNERTGGAPFYHDLSVLDLFSCSHQEAGKLLGIVENIANSSRGSIIVAEHGLLCQDGEQLTYFAYSDMTACALDNYDEQHPPEVIHIALKNGSSVSLNITTGRGPVRDVFTVYSFISKVIHQYLRLGACRGLQVKKS